MKILHVTYYDQYSGSGRASCRIHQALLRAGIDSEMLVMSRAMTDDPLVHQLPFAARLRAQIAQRIAGRIIRLQHDGNPCPHSLNLFRNPKVLQTINNSDADVIHLHWPGGEMLSVEQFAQIRKPVVWTLHDMWAFCGAEHHVNPFGKNDRFTQGYTKENCPENARGLDVDRFVFQRKVRCGWGDLPFVFAAPSRWLADAFTRSALFRGRPCSVVPNPLDLNCFHPQNKAEIRQKYGIPLDRKILLAGAQSNLAPIKGMHFFMEALRLLNDDNCLPVLFGAHGGELLRQYGILGMDFGTVSNEKIMSELYAAADVFVLPSILENLPCTAVEALSCGTPVAAFRVGGIPEIVTHRKDGCLAEPYQPQSLADAIQYCLQNAESLKPDDISLRNRFSMDSVTEQYAALYEQALKGAVK